MNKSEIKNGRDMQLIIKYLEKKYGEKVAMKIVELCARKLGFAITAKVIGGAIPGKKIADAASSGLRYMYFEGKLNKNQLTPYHPTKYQDQYVEFLIYSWARTGKPCYIPDPIIYAAPGSLATHR